MVFLSRKLLYYYIIIFYVLQQFMHIHILRITKKQRFFQTTVVSLATCFQSYGIGYTNVFTPSNHEPFFP